MKTEALVHAEHVTDLVRLVAEHLVSDKQSTKIVDVICKPIFDPEGDQARDRIIVSVYTDTTVIKVVAPAKLTLIADNGKLIED